MDPVNTTPVGEPHPYPDGCGAENCPDCWWLVPPRPKLPLDDALEEADAVRMWLGDYVARLARAAELIAAGRDTTGHPYLLDEFDGGYVAMLIRKDTLGVFNEVVDRLRLTLRSWHATDPVPRDPHVPTPLRWALEAAAGGGAAKAVLMVLAAHADGAGRISPGPSFAELSEETCLSRSTVCRALTHLERTGLIQRRRVVYRDGANASNDYQLCLPHPPAPASPRPTEGVTR